MIQLNVYCNCNLFRLNIHNCITSCSVLKVIPISIVINHTGLVLFKVFKTFILILIQINQLMIKNIQTYFCSI